MAPLPHARCRSRDRPSARAACPRRTRSRPWRCPPPAGAVDLVTETDKRCEALVHAHLSAAFPSHRFIGEEESAAQGFTDQLTDDPTWMVDPVDGEPGAAQGLGSAGQRSAAFCFGGRRAPLWWRQDRRREVAGGSGRPPGSHPPALSAQAAAGQACGRQQRALRREAGAGCLASGSWRPPSATPPPRSPQPPPPPTHPPTSRRHDQLCAPLPVQLRQHRARHRPAPGRGRRAQPSARRALPRDPGRRRVPQRRAHRHVGHAGAGARSGGDRGWHAARRRDNGCLLWPAARAGRRVARRAVLRQLRAQPVRSRRGQVGAVQPAGWGWVGRGG